MRLDLKDIIHVPGAKESFSCEMDLSNLDFYGTYPICEPVTVVGGNVGIGGHSLQ